MVDISFDDNTVLDFYNASTDVAPAKRTYFSNDTAINNAGIKNSNEERDVAIRPEVQIGVSRLVASNCERRERPVISEPDGVCR
jgi:hypothetical protein